MFNDEEAEDLADAYLKEGAITKKFYEDAVIIAKSEKSIFFILKSSISQ